MKYFWREKFKFCEHFQGDDFEVKNRERRDANGNRILRVVKRDATEMAEVETTEKIIQVRQKNCKVVKIQATIYVGQDGRENESES